ncbi:MAG: transglutaminase domain-containing protein, partial [Clostridia bacterium]|nr:transglutaminase domain-containing protein [Clostridia bacterium]
MDYREYRSQYNNTPERREVNPKSAKPILYAIIALALMLCIIVGVIISSAFSRPDYVARSVTVEAGRVSIEASDFLVDKSHSAEFGDGALFDLSAVGEYKIPLVVDGKNCTTKLIVIDTKAPEGIVRDMSVWQGSKLDAESCVSDIKDATEVSVKFKKKPDTDEIGKREVTVILEDGGGNTTEYTFVLNVVSSSGLLYTHYISELGEELPSADVFTGKAGVGEYLSDISSISPNAAGIYMLQISADGNTFDVVLEITDTVAPTATVTPQVCYNKIPEASEFISGISDKSRVTVSYETEPDMASSGRVDVNIVLTDAHGNKTVYSTYFEVMSDTKAPEILKAPDALEVDTGATIIWRASVEATDDSGKVQLDLDTTGADLDTPGVYTVEIVARDDAGNETRRKVKLTVHDGSITESMLFDVIKKIEKDLLITSKMNAEEKVYSVFRYVYDNMKYSNTSAHIDWKQEAYVTLNGGFTGDCFTYCATSYAILKYLGFDVHIVERAESAKIEGTGTHFWVLVNIGSEAEPKWYHFDATPQRSPYNLATYLMTNAQLEA